MTGSDRSLQDQQKNIEQLIQDLTILFERRDPTMSKIKSSKLLLEALTELGELVEMNEIKHSIIAHLKFLIVNLNRQSGSNFDNHMLHTVITGDPGTGKTTVARILAKIWTAVGMIKKNKQKHEHSLDLGERIKFLEEEQVTRELKLEKMRESLLHHKYLTNEIRKQVLSLNPTRPSYHRKTWNETMNNLKKSRHALDLVLEELEEIDQKEETREQEVKFTVVSRADLVGKYVGFTAPKTKAVLEKARGGVLFIDEAYSLYNTSSSSDSFGEECLTVINEYMSLYPEELIIIFSGYRDKIFETIFKAQPGLKRRCTHLFEIEPYSPRALALIFQLQLKKYGWQLAPEVPVERFIQEKKEYLTDLGGLADKLALLVKLEYADKKFGEVLSQTIIHDNVITLTMLEKAFHYIKEKKAPWGCLHMYS